VVVGILISYVDRSNLSIAAPVLMHDFGIKPELMGVLLSAFFWTYGAFQIPAGFVVDRIGVRRAYFLAFLTWSLASAATALSRNVETIFALRLLLGVAESIAPLASLTFIRHAFVREERGFPTAAYIVGLTLGPAVGTLLGSTLLALSGWRMMFAVTGLGALLWLPFWLAFARQGPRPAASTAPESPRTREWRAIVSQPSLLALSGCVFLFSYYWYFVLTWIPTYLTDSRGLSVLAMGRLLSTALFTMAPVNIAVGWIADRAIARGRPALALRIRLCIAGFLGGGIILLLDRANGTASILAILSVSVCFFVVASANFWIVVQHLAPGDLTARTIAFFNTLSQLAGVVAPIITGHTLGPAKNFSLAIVLAGSSTLCASLLLLMAGPRGVGQLLRHLE
jgi:ACS family D-galactonate transporter-like MFS transporter